MVMAWLGMSLQLQAQTWPQSSWWSLEPARFNPASSAQAYSLSATGLLRRQWINIPGSPTTLGATFASPVYRYQAGGALAIENDRIGVFAITQVRGSASFSVIRRENLDVSVGAGGNLRAAEIAGGDLRTAEGEYGNGQIDHLDPLLPNGSVSATTIGLDAGVTVLFGETQIGISALDINAPRGDYDRFGRVWPRTYTAFAKTTLPISERLDLQFGVLAYNDARLTQVQAHAFAWYNGNIGAGAAFRGAGTQSSDALSLLLGWRASGTLTFAYAYDAGLSALKSVHDGSHEISVRFVMADPIGRGRLPPIIFSPRL